MALRYQLVILLLGDWVMGDNKKLLWAPIMRSLLAAVLGLATAGGALAQGNSSLTEPDLALRGDAVCTRCHDAESEVPVLAIGATKHGTVADGRTPTCTSCHGASETHIKKPANTQVRPKPTVVFSKKGGSTPEIQSQACLSCHQAGKQVNWQSSVHASRDITCTSCHTVHAKHDPVRNTITQPETCFSCHKEQRSQIDRPSHHPIPEGKMTCSSCHNPHDNHPKQLIKSSTNDTCYTCHAEKRGPWVHNHQPVTEDCSICHNPHGTVVSSLLKSRPPFLCQECHSHSSHPSQAAGLPTGIATSSSLLGSVGRGCLNCHTNIHGSNSTQNSATVGRFRR